MKAGKLFLRAVLVLSLLAGGVLGTGEASASDTEIPAGYVDLESFGGYASDNKDDTEAFRAALATGQNIWLRRGDYMLHETLEVTDQAIVGGGESTKLYFSNPDPSTPAIRLGGVCMLKDLVVQFEEKLLTGEEKAGERVLVWLGGRKPVEPGSQLRSVGLNRMGTGIYSPNEENCGASGLRINTVTVTRYVYRGVDFQKDGQYGNVFYNLYIAAVQKFREYADVAFAVEGREYNLQVDQLNIEGMPVHTDLLLRNCRNAQFGSVHMEQVKLAEPDSGLVKVENSTVRIDGLTAYYIFSDKRDTALIELGEAREGSGSYLNIGTLHFKGFGSEASGFKSDTGSTFKIVKHTKGAGGTFRFKLDRYAWYTWLGEADRYAAFPCDEEGIRYLSKGVQE